VVGASLFAVSPSLPIGLNAVGFAVAAIVLLSLPGKYRPTRVATSTIRRDVAEGVRWLRNHTFLRRLTVISAVTAFSSSLTSGVLVLYAEIELRLPPGDYGYVLFAGGAGALLGGLATPRLAHLIGRGPALTVGGVIGAVALGAMSLTRNGVVGACLLGGFSAGVLVWNVLTMSLRQSLIPEELFGRVQGAYRTLVFGGVAAGSLLGGLLAHLLGLRQVFAVAGALLLVTAVALGRVCHLHRDQLTDVQSGAEAARESSGSGEGVSPDGVSGLVGALPPEEVTDVRERVQLGSRNE
jgi:predicted MFS family arabinose efflux permease